MTQELGETVAATLRAELARREISRGDFAERLGKSHDWLSRRLAGRIDMTLSDLDLMCRELRLTPAQLFAVHDLMQAQPARKRTAKKTGADRVTGRRPRATTNPSGERNGS